MIKALLFSLGVFYVLDIYTTVVGLKMGLTEGNVVVAWMLENSELSLFVLLKVMSMLFVIYIVSRLLKKGLRRGTMVTLILINISMALVVIWNARMIWLQ